MGGAPDLDHSRGFSDDDHDPDLSVVPAFEPTSDPDDSDPDDSDAHGSDPDDSDLIGSRSARNVTPFDAGGDQATRIAHAKQRHGAAGGMLAAGMLGIDQLVNGRKPREEIPVVVTASSDPVDIDTDGIRVSLAGADVIAPALPRTLPKTPPARRRRWR